MRARQPRQGACPLVPLVLLALAAAPACGGSSSPTSPSQPSGPAVTLPSLEGMLADKVLGSADAPITMLEYSSLTCYWCADFHASTLPLIRSQYIDPGKVKLVYRDFPLDTGAALSASMVARCSGDRFFTVIELLYRSQGTWAGSSNPTSALKSTVASTGMTGAEVDACLALTDLRNGILAIRSKGQSDYGITGTPTFIISNNGQKVAGSAPFGTFDTIFKGLL